MPTGGDHREPEDADPPYRGFPRVEVHVEYPVVAESCRPQQCLRSEQMRYTHQDESQARQSDERIRPADDERPERLDW